VADSGMVTLEAKIVESCQSAQHRSYRPRPPRRACSQPAESRYKRGIARRRSPKIGRESATSKLWSIVGA